MYLTSISLAYVFFAISIISLAFFVYFKFLVVKTSDKSNKKDKIIGNMKNPQDWRKRNNIMSLISLSWSLISIGIFVYLKFFFKSSLILIFYLIGYIAAITFSIILFMFSTKKMKNNTKS